MFGVKRFCDALMLMAVPIGDGDLGRTRHTSADWHNRTEYVLVADGSKDSFTVKRGVERRGGGGSSRLLRMTCAAPVQGSAIQPAESLSRFSSCLDTGP
jgi:hypothetical protein